MLNDICYPFLMAKEYHISIILVNHGLHKFYIIFLYE